MIGINTNYTQRRNQPNFGMTLKFPDEDTLQKGIKLLGDSFISLPELERTSKGKGYAKFIKELVPYNIFSNSTKGLFVLEKSDLPNDKLKSSVRFSKFKNLFLTFVNISSKNVNKASDLLTSLNYLFQKTKLNVFEKLRLMGLRTKIRESIDPSEAISPYSRGISPVGRLLKAKYKNGV